MKLSVYIDANTLQNNIIITMICSHLWMVVMDFTIFDSYGDGLNGSMTACDADSTIYQLINDSGSVVFKYG